LRRGFPVVLLVLGLFAVSPTARAVDPPPDGGYPGNDTAEGDNALFSLTTGDSNTVTGGFAFQSNTTGNDNTANGESALINNTTGNDNTANGVTSISAMLATRRKTARFGSGKVPKFAHHVAGRLRANAPTLSRTKSLIDAALRVWELKQRTR
jgi:hypothetical protein